jgi:hypothetical protein
MWMGKCGNRAPGWVDGKYSLLLPVAKFWWELVCFVPPPLEPELPPNTYTTLNFDKLIKQHWNNQNW